ncbi:tight adherence protein C [Gracilibacillus ureilyticus]|uniref:Tight adherence protein C n=1 Tax=Gracilibacillus ureilyticus TaxID=531814 RepID=A0A1H9V4Y2_9BACI|nr:type II secretion system F family protein [Gracilibacillus ureilyticus]SES16722.1 tight adherence protein C [Gracilibacillus ureilyticus]
MIVLISSFFLFISLLSYILLILLTSRTSHVESRLEAYFAPQIPAGSVDLEEETTFMKRVVSPFWENLQKKFIKRIGKEEANKLETLLLQAGQPFQLNPVKFKLVQFFTGIILPVTGGGYALLLGLSFNILLLIVVISIGIAAILPKRLLRAKAEKRSKEAVKEMPDLLDLLTISLEAGLGFDAALHQVVSKKDGILAEEFKTVLEEMRLGKTRKEALIGLSDRVVSEDVRAFVSSIIQAEKLGVGMVSVLRVQTEDLRVTRKQKAEEKAMKAPIKMMFPLVLFIFPTLFIILLGPAILQLMENF